MLLRGMAWEDVRINQGEKSQADDVGIDTGNTLLASDSRDHFIGVLPTLLFYNP